MTDAKHEAPAEGAGEDAAKLIYEAMKWAAEHAGNDNIPAWVEGGNSFAQDQARSFIPPIVAALARRSSAPKAREPDVVIEVTEHSHPVLGTYGSITNWSNRSHLPAGQHNLYTHPTTRETADHAELAACPFCGGSATIERFGNTRVSTQYQCDDCGCFLETGEEFHHGRAWNRRPREEALLSEIAALRGERKGLKNRVSCLERLCGEQSTRVMEQATRAKDAERQRDEAVGLLRELAGGRSQKNNINEYDDLSVRASTLLSNQGADQ